MTRITKSDQLAILLRQQLSQLSRRKTSSTGSAKGQSVKSGSGLSRVQQIAASNGFSDSDVQRALIQGLLEEELGDGLMNDAKFQQLINRVHSIIRDDPDALMVLKESVKQLEKLK